MFVFLLRNRRFKIGPQGNLLKGVHLGNLILSPSDPICAQGGFLGQIWAISGTFREGSFFTQFLVRNRRFKIGPQGNLLKGVHLGNLILSSKDPIYAQGRSQAKIQVVLGRFSENTVFSVFLATFDLPASRPGRPTARLRATL